MPASIQLVIFSRDRADFLKKTLDSALKQDYSEITYEIIISDNSADYIWKDKNST